jgi:hypothetical protein
MQPVNTVPDDFHFIIPHTKRGMNYDIGYGLPSTDALLDLRDYILLQIGMILLSVCRIAQNAQGTIHACRVKAN